MVTRAVSRFRTPLCPSSIWKMIGFQSKKELLDRRTQHSTATESIVTSIQVPLGPKRKK